MSDHAEQRSEVKSLRLPTELITQRAGVYTAATHAAFEALVSFNFGESFFPVVQAEVPIEEVPVEIVPQTVADSLVAVAKSIVQHEAAGLDAIRNLVEEAHGSVQTR